MRIIDRRTINRQVRLFIKAMPKGYEDSVPKDVLISEILALTSGLYKYQQRWNR